MKKIQSIRGMNDILPEQTAYWQYLETTIQRTLKQYQVNEIRLPILEKSELFHRGVGNGTDIVEKETYDFTDRNQEALTLRPEGTAGCVRSVIQHNLAQNQSQKLWYIGPMYRYERPQKGRYRQFYQLGIEFFGISGSVIEAELIALTWRLWQNLQIDQAVMLEVNNLGNQSARQAYSQALVEHFEPIKEQLDADSQKRLYKNPLRILDSKNKQTQHLLAQAPKIDDYLDEDSKNQFDQLCAFLSRLNIPYRINPNLVRGLDYYTHTVFEWKTDQLGAQDTICAGGRYDALTEQLGGSQTPAIGLAMGLERLLLLLEITDHLPEIQNQVDVFIASNGERPLWEGLMISERLRQALPGLSIITNTTSSSFKAQFKRADRLGACVAIIIGEQEIASEQYGVKYLKERREQEQLHFNQILERLKSII